MTGTNACERLAARSKGHLRQPQTRQRGPGESAADTGDEGQFENSDICEIDLIFLDLAHVRRKRQRQTPSLSLRLRSVRYARADSDVLRTSPNRVLVRSVGVSQPFECGMTKVAVTA